MEDIKYPTGLLGQIKEPRAALTSFARGLPFFSGAVNFHVFLFHVSKIRKGKHFSGQF